MMIVVSTNSADHRSGAFAQQHDAGGVVGCRYYCLGLHIH